MVIERFTEEEELYKVDAVIYVMRTPRRGSLSETGSIAKTATGARIEMEKFFKKGIFADVVKVNPNWRKISKNSGSSGTFKNREEKMSSPDLDFELEMSRSCGSCR